MCCELCRNPAPLFRRSADAQCFAALPQTSSQLRCRRVRRFRFPPPSAESAPGGECRAKRVVRQAVSVAAPRLRALVATRVETRRTRTIQQLSALDAACVAAPRQRARAPRTPRAEKESATLYVAKRRANKPVLPQASSYSLGSRAPDRQQLQAVAALLATKAVRAKSQGFSLTYTQIGR